MKDAKDNLVFFIGFFRGKGDIFYGCLILFMRINGS